MGYVSRNIANIEEPGRITLAGVPNFVRFSSKTTQKLYYETRIRINITPSFSGNIPEVTELRITNAEGDVRSYRGTTDPTEAGGSVFFVSENTSDTAENLHIALISDDWVNANFEVSVPAVWAGNTPVNGSTVYIKSKGAGTAFNIILEASGDPGSAAYTITPVNLISKNNDSISGENSTVEIDLDIYADADIFPGENDRPVTQDKLGRYVTVLKKTYAGTPVWFELNSLFSQYGGYNAPPSYTGWFDAGTWQTFRFVAKVKGANSFPFYYSNALYTVHGYGKPSEKNDLSPYVYNGNAIRLLTEKPRTPYVRGQKEFINFIFEDPQRGAPSPVNFTLRVVMRAYTTSGEYLGAMYGHERTRAAFSVVNTCLLDFTPLLDAYPKTGILKVGLARGNSRVSNETEYIVLPECLHGVRQFFFINRLGGWDTFNFDTGLRDEIKPSYETYDKTVTPDYGRGDSPEKVYSSVLENSFTAEGSPVTDEVALWLKELAASRVVLDGEGNYVIIEDFTLNVSDADRNLHRPTIKYRLGEKYRYD